MTEKYALGDIAYVREIKKLKAEVEQLRKTHSLGLALQDRNRELAAEIERLRAHPMREELLEQYRAEVERLRDALIEITEVPAKESFGSLPNDDVMVGIARKALRG